MSPNERRAFLDFVSCLITSLDITEWVHYTTLIAVSDDMPASRAHEAVATMIKSGLLVSERFPHHTILSITLKGRALAADIRKLAEKAVRS